MNIPTVTKQAAPAVPDMYRSRSNEWKHGYDAGLNGPNDRNSHFSHFSTRDGMKDWQDGNNKGKSEKGRNSKQKAGKHNPRKK